MPSSRGLFGRVIMQSNPLGLPFRSAKKYPSSKVVARKANCTVVCWRVPRRAAVHDGAALSKMSSRLRAQHRSDSLADVGQFFVSSALRPRSTLSYLSRRFGMLTALRLMCPCCWVSSARGRILRTRHWFGLGVVGGKRLSTSVGLQHERKIFKQYPLSPAVRRPTTRAIIRP